MDIVILGLSLASSWGNGHATTFRALIKGLAAEGHRVLFLEREVPWYAGSNRDLPDPDFCELVFYHSLDEVQERHGDRLRTADAVIVGSYVPEGAALIDRLAAMDLKRLCFYDIDTPVTMDLLDKGEEAHLARRQVPVFDLYFSFSGGKVLDRLSEVYGARAPRALYCSVDESRYTRADVPMRWDMGYLGTYSDDRQPGLEALMLEPARRLPHMKFVVAGAQYPDGIDWPDNVERIEHLPPREHAAFYSAQRFTLNITRVAMRRLGWSPSVRLFEAAAVGTPILSDRWEGLGELLPEGEAIVIADGTDAAVAALTGEDGTRPEALAARAHEIVLADHTGRARAAELAHMLQECPGRERRREREETTEWT
ncbi:CgeB family protein [Palleronia marisminoris]|nr:glycosyltransferase [Palleronia marisminoris]